MELLVLISSKSALFIIGCFFIFKNEQICLNAFIYFSYLCIFNTNCLCILNKKKSDSYKLREYFFYVKLSCCCLFVLYCLLDIWFWINWLQALHVTLLTYLFISQWNEVTKLFRAGMPLKKHRQHLRVYSSCFTASAAVDWLHELLKNNSNFGPEVTRQQTIQLLKKFLKNHVIEDVKGRWGMEDLEDNSQLYRYDKVGLLIKLDF